MLRKEENVKFHSIFYTQIKQKSKNKKEFTKKIKYLSNLIIPY